MSRLRTYAQLVRLPNLPSALADICLGALALYALPAGWLPFVLMLCASACLYTGGMVWNDYFDRDQDQRERPDRPIPSGRVTLRAARLVGIVLLAGGFLFALLSGWAQTLGSEGGAASLLWRPGILAALLVLGILLYDGLLKRTWLGPPGMGACRFLNVLLGACVAGASFAWGPALHLALVVGVYIVGVTWFARTEARTSNKPALIGASVVMLVALLLALPVPVFVPRGHASSILFPYLLVALGFLVGTPIIQAIANPVPSQVQAGIKRALLGLILLDAVLAIARAGEVGLVILILLVPALYLNRKGWLYAT
jgi:4-hydroxybenzoate polyprenyltransferase